jgi:hypothetical protein
MATTNSSESTVHLWRRGTASMKTVVFVPLGRSRRRWVDFIEIDLREIRWGDMSWIDLAQNRDKWRVLAITVMNLHLKERSAPWSQLISGMWQLRFWNFCFRANSDDTGIATINFWDCVRWFCSASNISLLGDSNGSFELYKILSLYVIVQWSSISRS